MFLKMRRIGTISCKSCQVLLSDVPSSIVKYPKFYCKESQVPRKTRRYEVFYMRVRTR